MRPEEKVNKAYLFISPKDILKEPESKKAQASLPGVVSLSGYGESGGTYTVQAIRESVNPINPTLRQVLGEENLTLKSNEGYVLPSDLNKISTGRKSGDVSQFEEGLIVSQDQSMDPVSRSKSLNSELTKIEEQLLRDLESQKTLISGTEKTIQGLRDEMKGIGYKFSSGVSGALNLGYAAGHHISKWANIGILKEEPISLDQQNQRVIAQWQMEIDFRTAKVKEIEDKLNALRSQKSVVDSALVSGNESVQRRSLESVVNATKGILNGSREQSEEVRNLEFKWKAQKDYVDKGFQNFDDQVGYQEAFLHAGEKAVVAAGATLVVFATGGAALPFYAVIAYGVGIGMTASLIQAGIHLKTGSDLKTELEDVKTDFKDAILYSAGGLVHKAWLGAKTLVTGGKVLGYTAEVGAGEAATAYVSTSISKLSGWVSNAGIGLRNELLPAAYDSFYHDSMDTLDPTGSFREAGVAEWRLRMKNFSERIGSAGASGAVAHSLVGIRGKYGLSKCFEGGRAGILSKVGMGIRGGVVEAGTDAVELGVDLLNTLYVQATLVPFLYGVDAKSKDEREMIQMVASSLGGTVTGHLSTTLRDQVDKIGMRHLTKAKTTFETSGQQLENRHGVNAPTVAVSSSYLPVVIEGNKRTTVASNVSSEYGLIDRSTKMQEHRMQSKQAAMIDARKGGVVSDIVRNSGNTFTGLKRELGYGEDKTIIGQRKTHAVDVLAKSVERRASGLANAEIDDHYVTRLLNERKIQSGSKSNSMWEKFLGFVDRARNPYGAISEVDSVVESQIDAGNSIAKARAEKRAKFLDTTVVSLGPIELKWGGVKLFGRNVAFYDGKKVNLFGLSADVSNYQTKIWDSTPMKVIRGIPEWGPVTLFKDVVLKPVAGISLGAMLLPTPGIAFGPGVPFMLAHDGVRKGLFNTIPSKVKDIIWERGIRSSRIGGYGDAIATGEMLARKVELEQVRTEYANRVGTSPSRTERNNLRALDSEIKKAEKYFNRANNTGLVSRWWGSWLTHGWFGLTPTGWRSNGQLITANNRAHLEAQVKTTFSSALGRKSLAMDTVDTAARNVISNLRSVRGTKAADARNKVMAEVNLLIGERTAVSKSKVASIKSSLEAEITRLLLTARPPEAVLLNGMLADIRADSVSKYRKFLEKGTNLKRLQDSQNDSDRNRSIERIFDNLERNVTTPAQALVALQSLFDHPTLGKSGMLHGKGERRAYEQFKQKVESEVRLLSRRSQFRTGRDVLGSPEYAGLLTKVIAGDAKADQLFKSVFGSSLRKTRNRNFVSDVLCGAGSKSIGTPLEAYLRNWTTFDHPTKLNAILQAESELLRLRAIPAGTPGALSTATLIICDDVLMNARSYENFATDVILNKPNTKNLNALIKSQSTHASTPIRPAYGNIRDFSRLYNDPVQFIASRLTRYERLRKNEKRTVVEQAELAILESDFRNLRSHVGDDIFRATLGEVGHIQERDINLAQVRNSNKLTLSPILKIDPLLSVLSKAGDSGNKDHKVNLEQLTQFAESLAGKVTKKELNRIIDSDGLEFAPFYRVVAELRSPATTAVAEARLRTALGFLGLKGKRLDRAIVQLKVVPSAAEISQNAGKLGMTDAKFIDFLRQAYGDRADIVAIYGASKINLGAKNDMRKRAEKIATEDEEIFETNLRAINGLYNLK